MNPNKGKSVKMSVEISQDGQEYVETTYGFLNLSLVGLEHLLELVNQILHLLVVLPVLFGLERELLDPTVSLSEVLLCVGMVPLLSIQLLFQSSQPRLELGNDLLTSLHGVTFGDFETLLEFLCLVLKLLSGSLLAACVLLFHAELVGESRCVDHGLLRLLLAVLRLVEDLLKVGLKVDNRETGLTFVQHQLHLLLLASAAPASAVPHGRDIWTPNTSILQ